MLYVLIVISVAYNGQTVTTQEFTSEKNCMIALEHIKTKSRWLSLHYSTCVVK
jgi:hypothetical protein